MRVGLILALADHYWEGELLLQAWGMQIRHGGKGGGSAGRRNQPHTSLCLMGRGKRLPDRRETGAGGRDQMMVLKGSSMLNI